MIVDIKKLIELGMSLKFSYKDSLDSWYCEVGFCYIRPSSYKSEGSCYFSNTPFSDKNITIEDGLYLYFAYIKHWKNLAYSIDRIRKIDPNFFDEGYDGEDIDLIVKEQEKVKEEWNKQFDIVKLKDILNNDKLFEEVFIKEYIQDEDEDED